MKTPNSRVHGTKPASSIARGSRARRRKKVDFDRLEDRTLLTVLFTPQVTPVTVQDFGGPKLGTQSPGVDINMIFWGSYWQTSAGQAQAADDMSRVNPVLGNGLLTGLHQYGSPYGIASVATKSVYDTTTDPGTDFTDAQIQAEVDHAISTLGLSDSSNAIYYVVTPPGAQYVNHSYGGYHGPETLSNGSSRYYGWLGNFGSTTSDMADWFTSILSKETLETFSDPATNVHNGIIVTSLPGEICDGEAGNYTALLSNNLVQSFWSNADSAYAIYDGNRQKVTINQRSLIINGDQNGVVNDVVSLGLNFRGGVVLTLNGEVFSFAPNTINQITVNTGAGTNNVVTISSLLTIRVALNGGATGNTLVGPNSDNLWQLNGTNSGNLGLFSFQGFANLYGGTGNDTFTFAASSSLGGRIDGGAGNNTIDESAQSIPINLNVQNSTVTGLQNPFANIQNVIGGTNAANTLLGPTTDTTYNITGQNTGSVNGLSFSQFGNITAGAGNDRFVFNDAATLSGAMSGGAGSNTINESAYSTSVTTNLSAKTITGVGSTYSSIQTFIAGTIAGGTLVGLTTSATYNITGINAVTVAGLTYNNFSSITGGAGNDIFLFSPGASLGGSINGGLGNNTINESAFTTPIALNLAAGTITGLGSPFANIQTITGGSGASTLVGPAASSTYRIMGPNAGNVGTFNFTNFGIITAGAGNDIFKFTSGGIITGTIDGGGGTNTIDETLLTTPVTLNVAASTLSQLTGTFTNIQTVLAGGNSANLILGPSTDSTFNITGTNAGTIAGISFSGFGNLTGGAGNDTYTFAPSATLLGRLDGGAGTNTLDYSSLTTAVSLSLATSIATDIRTSFANIQNVLGGTNTANLLIGPATGSTYRITGKNTGSVNTLAFRGFSSIVAGAGNDVVIYSDGALLTGSLNLGLGANTLDESAYTTSVNVNLSTVTITGVGTNYAGVIQTLKGSATAGGTLTGTGANSVYNLTGTNAGNVGGMAFNSFSSLTGGAGNDTFLFSAGASLGGTINGGLGTNSINELAYTTPVALNLVAGTVTGLGVPFANIQTIIAGSGANTLTGPSAGSTYRITGPNTGNVGAFNFTNFGIIAAGAANDVFKFAGGGIITGTIDGGGGSNTIDETLLTSPVTLNLPSSTISQLSGTFTNIQTVLAGGNSANQILGPSTNSTFNLTGTNAGNIVGLSFSGFGNLTGGAGNDTFTFGPSATLLGRLDGGAGTNTIDYTSLTTAVTLNLPLSTATGIRGTFANIQNVIGGTNNANTLLGPTAATTYNITSQNTGTVNGLSFSHFGYITAGAGNDRFVFSDAATLTGALSGGAGSNTIDESAYSTTVTANFSTNTITGVGTTYSSIQSFIAGTTAGGTLTGPATASTYKVTGLNAVTVAGLTYNNFSTLTGGAGNDIFLFSSGASLGGTINGGPGTNSIDESAYTTPVTLNLVAGTVTGLASPFTNIQTIIAGSAANTLVGPSASSTFRITGSNAGNVGAFNFTNFGILTAGSANDVFKFTSGGIITGKIDGGGGSNSIDETLLTTPVTLNVASSTVSQLTGTFSNIQSVLAGGNTANQILGPTTDSTFNITGTNAGTIAGLSFSGFSNLTGGAGNDTFTFGPASTLLGRLDGGAGTNTLDYSSLTTTVSLNLVTGTATDVRGTFANIQNVLGGTNTANLLTGPATGSNYRIIGRNSGSVNGLAFSGFGGIVAGAGDDIVVYSDGALLTGSLNLGLGANSLDESAYTNSVNVNLSTKTITGVGTNYAGVIQTLKGSANAGGTLTGTAANSIYNITGANAGNVGGMAFLSFYRLVAGSGNDAFVFGDGASLTGGIDGGAGSNSIDESAYSTSVKANLSAMTISGVSTSFANIQTLKGSTTAGGTLTGPSTSATFTLLALNTGTVNATTFLNFTNLTGGAGDDQFVFRNLAAINGVVDGGQGNNTIDESGYTTAVALNLQTNTLTGMTSFTRVQSFVGSSTAYGTLAGSNTSTTYTISAKNTGNVAGISFSNLATLVGGAGDDAFSFGRSGSLTGSIDGGGGTNTIDESSFTTTISLNLANNSLTGIASPFANIQKVLGGSSAANQVVAPNTSGLINITGANTGNAANVIFAGFGNLVGGSANDLFVFSDGASVTGAIDGGAGTNGLDYSAYSTTIAVNLTTGKATGVGTTVSHVQYVRGRSSGDTLNLSVSPTSPTYGQVVSFTATVSPAAATGTVIFLDGLTPLNPGGTTLDGSGHASFSLSSLSVGTHQITATYSGDLNYASATSSTASVPIAQDPTTTAIHLSSNTSVFGQSVTVTAAVSPTAATGKVIFYDGATALNPSGVTLDATGQASFVITGLTVGSHSIRAVYGGDTNDATSSSIVLTEKVGAVSLFQDPSVQFAVLQALGLPSNHLLVSQDLASLTTLSLDSSQVHNLSGLETATNLVSVSLVPSDFSHTAVLSSLVPLENLPHLTSLTLQGCGLTDSMLSGVPATAFPVLQSLDLRYNNVSVLPSSIASLPALSTISLYGNPLANSPRAGLVNLAGKLVNIDLPPDHPELSRTISDLSAALYNLPIEIYQYVTNTITYQPYAGAMKGPLAVLQTGAGNDWDTDSFLAALLAQSSGTPITQYASGLVGENIPTVMKWLGVKTPASAYEVLYYAGLRPTFGNLTSNSQNQQVFTAVDVSQANTATYIVFDHSWLQAKVNVPGAGSETVNLDPSWKFRDFQPGLPGLLGTVPFDSAGYLNTVSTQLAYEYYQNQVRNYLAANQPGLTVADVAYDGPIHPVSFSTLPTTLPYDLDAIQSINASIPTASQNRVQISVDIQSAGTIAGSAYNSSTNQSVLTVTGASPFNSAMVNEPLIDLTNGNQVYTILSVTSSNKVVVQGDASHVTGASFAIPGVSTLQNVADISLDRITIVAPGTGTVRPQLTFTGPTPLSLTSTLTVLSTSAIYPIIQYLPGTLPGGWNYAYTHVYSRFASQYIAVGLDASQTSEQSLVAARAVVNTADIALADGGNPSKDDLIGGVLNLALVDYNQQNDHAKIVVGGLTGAIPIYNAVTSGLASSDTSTNTTKYANEQILYLPGGLGIDLPGSLWDSVGIADPSVSTPGQSGPNQPSDSARDTLTGYNASDMEAAVWEDLANVPALSTITSLQYANQNSISIATITSANLGSISSILSGLQDSIYAQFNASVIRSITAFVNQSSSAYDYRVIVPTRETPYGTDANNRWVGVGYVVQNSPHGANTWMNTGFIIQGYLISNGVAGPLQAPHGGAMAGYPLNVVISPPSLTGFTIGDPINISDGDVINSATDVNIPNLGAPLAFQRHYSSIETSASGNSLSDRGMGDGWSFTFGDTITTSPNPLDPAGTKIWFTDTGVQLKFVPDGHGGYVTPNTIFGTLVFNGAGHGYTWTSKTGQIIAFTDGGKLVSIRDRFGNGVLVSYDSSAHIAKVSDLVTPSRSLTFTYTGNHITSIADFTGRTWTYNYGSTGQLASVTAPSDSSTPKAVTSYTYYMDTALNHLLMSINDAGGNQTSFSYYVNRRGFQVTEPNGATQTVSGDFYRNITSYTNERGITSYYKYDAQGNETQEIRPDGSTQAYTWSNGLMTSSTDAYGQTQSYVYDANGNIIKQTDQLGHVTDTTYTDYGNPSTVTRESDNAQIVYQYFTDASGKNSYLKKVIDPLGGITSYTYPAVNRGLPASMTTPNGNLPSASGYTTSYSYNLAGELTSSIAAVASGQVITQSSVYDNRGNLIASVDGNGNVTTSTYDLLGHLISRTLPDPDGSGPLTAPTTTYVYDALGELIQQTSATSSPVRTTRYVYDSMQRLIQQIQPDGTYLTNSFDGSGNPVASTDALGRVTRSVYDSRDRAVDTIFPDGGVLIVGYDGGGRTVRTTDAMGNTSIYQYDKLGRKIAFTTPDPDGAGPLTASTTLYGYDAQGNLQYVTDALGTSLGDPNHSTTYQYDKLGRKTAMLQADPDGSGSLTRPSTTYQYDANGNLLSVTDPRGFTTTYQYDQQNRKTAQIQPDPDGNGPLGASTTLYFYDNNNNLRFVVNPSGSDPSQTTATTENQYDALNRVILVIQPDPDGSGPLARPTTISTYDQNGNLSTTTDALGNITRYAYDLLNRRVSTTDALGGAPGDPAHTTVTVYDAVGNALFTTDALGRLTLNQYDPMNRLIQQTLPKPDASNIPAPTTTYQYDLNGNRIQQVDPLGHTTFYQFDALNRSVGVTDAMASFSGDRWNTSVTAYDVLGRVISQTDQLGRVTQLVYDNLGRKIEVIQPDPDDLTSIGLQNGSQTSPTTYFSYDANGNLISTIDPLGHTTTYGYDGLNRPNTTTDALNGVTTKAYDVRGNVIAVTDQMGRTTNFVFDSLNRMTAQIQPDPGTGIRPTTRHAYDADGNVVTTTDPLGHTTTTVYDGLNRVIKTIDSLGGTTTNVYDAAGELLQVTDPAGNTTSYVYDGLGRLVSDTDALNHTETFVHDAAGNLISKTDRNGQVTQYAYDPLNRVITENWLNAGGQTVHSTRTYYDIAGQVVGVVDPGASYGYVYDRDGRLIQTRMAPGDLAQQTPLTLQGALGDGNDGLFDWDRSSVAEHYDGYSLDLIAGATVLLTLDSSAFSPVLLVQAPNGSTDPLRIVENKGNGEVTLVFTADMTGTWTIGVTERGTAAGPYTLNVSHTQSPFLNVNGVLNSQSPKLTVPGIINNQPYSAWSTSLTAGEHIQGQLSNVSGFSPVVIAQAPDGTLSVWVLGGNGSFTFDPATSGVWTIYVTSQSVTSGSFSLVLGTDSGPFVSLAMTQSSKTYDANGNLTQIVDSAGGTTGYQYDALNRVTQVTESVNGVVNAQANYSYRADGAISTLNRYSNGGTALVATSVYSYDGIGRLIGLVDTNGNGATLVSDSWTFDAAGRMTSMSTLDGMTTYSLDNTNQLTGAVSGYQASESYAYDANGNRINSGYVTGPDNQLLSDGSYNYSYDNNGNLILRTRISDHSTTVYTYDYRDRLTSVVSKDPLGNVTQTVTYTYDASNQMIRRGLDPDGAGAAAMTFTYTDYENGAAYLLLSDSDPLGLAGPTVPNLSQRYLYSPAVDQLLAETDFTSGVGKVFWGLADHEQTIRDLVDSSGAVVDHRTYNSFGQITSETNASISFPFAYTGERLDSATGLTNLNARWYNAAAGRFINEDPSGFASGDTNFYRYVRNNPLTMIDPTGLNGVNTGSYDDSLTIASLTVSDLFDGRNALGIAARSLLPNSGPLNLWSGQAARTLALSAPGFTLQNTPFQSAALGIEGALESYYGKGNIPQRPYNFAWGMPSAAGLATSYVAGQGFTTSNNFDDPLDAVNRMRNGQPSVQVGYEKPAALLTSIAFTGVFDIAPGIAQMYNAVTNEDTPTAQRGLEFVAGASQVIGGGININGAINVPRVLAGPPGSAPVVTQSTAWGIPVNNIQLGTQIANFGGGLGTLLSSSTALGADLAQDRYVSAVGDASMGLGGGLLAASQTPFVQSSAAWATVGGRFLGVGGAIVNGYNAYDDYYNKHDTSAAIADGAGALGGVLLTAATYAAASGVGAPAAVVLGVSGAVLSLVPLGFKAFRYFTSPSSPSGVSTQAPPSTPAEAQARFQNFPLGF